MSTVKPAENSFVSINRDCLIRRRGPQGRAGSCDSDILGNLNAAFNKGGGSPQLYHLPRQWQFGTNVPAWGHTTRAPPVGFELATNDIQFYDSIAKLKKTSLYPVKGIGRIGPGVALPDNNPVIKTWMIMVPALELSTWDWVKLDWHWHVALKTLACGPMGWGARAGPETNSGRGSFFVLEIRGQTDQSNIKQNKVFKYILRFQYLFCFIIIYYDIWNQLEFIIKFLSNHDMVW